MGFFQGASKIMQTVKLPLNFLESVTGFTVHSGVVFKEGLYISLGAWHESANDGNATGYIARYNREDKNWDILHKKDFNHAPSDSPRNMGFIDLKVHSGLKGKELGIIAMEVSPDGSRYLYGINGQNFTPLEKNKDIQAGPFQSYGGGVVASLMEESGEPDTIYYFTDLSKGKKKSIHDSAFHLSGNAGVVNMTVFRRNVYISVKNFVNGFQIWKATKRKDAFKWHKILDQGAFQFSLNPSAPAMVEFKDTLYLGTAQSFQGDRGDWDNEGAEIIRILPDNTWELVLGTPRFSPLGLQIPISSMGRGFNVPGNTELTDLIEHKGKLFAFIGNRAGDGGRKNFQVWGTENGEQWLLCADNGSRESGNDISGIISMPFGILLKGRFSVTRDEIPMLRIFIT